jgi:hypothetical protein
MNSFDRFMQSIPQELQLVNELKVPKQILGSFVSIGTPGFRAAPEILVLELMREVFYEFPVVAAAATEVDPRLLSDSNAPERLSIEAARGRSRQGRGTAARPYYAPLYPEQARSAALRGKTDRVLLNNFLCGPLSHAWTTRPETEMRLILRAFVDALNGRSRPLADSSRVDIMAAAMNPNPAGMDAAGFQSPDEAVEYLVATVRDDKAKLKLPPGNIDPLAERMISDLAALCALEGSVPRLLWLELLKTFLRLALAMWVLAQARLTVFLRDEILGVVEGVPPLSLPEVVRKIVARGHELVRPLTTPSLELHEHVVEFGRARVELSVLLYALYTVRPAIAARGLTVTGGGKDISVDELLLEYKSASVAIRALADEGSFTQWLRRGCEHFPMWLRPEDRGQAKNLAELLRVLWVFDIDDNDEGYLARKVTGSGNALIIFPGPGLTKLMCFFAERARQAGGRSLHTRRLLLHDLEQHFREYGIDFARVAGARPRLLDQLSRLGILKGSPDAGDGAWIDAPMSRLAGRD